MATTRRKPAAVIDKVQLTQKTVVTLEDNDDYQEVTLNDVINWANAVQKCNPDAKPEDIIVHIGNSILVWTSDGEVEQYLY